MRDGLYPDEHGDEVPRLEASRPEIENLLSILDKEERVQLLEELLDRGYSKRELAELMGVTPAAVSRFFGRRAYPGTDTLTRLFLRLPGNDRAVFINTLLLKLTRLVRALSSIAAAVSEEASGEDLERIRVLAEELEEACLELSFAVGASGGAQSSRSQLGERDNSSSASSFSRLFKRL